MLNVARLREDFPVLNENPNLAYLDNAASTLKPKCVIDEVDGYYNKLGVNVHRGVYKLSYLATDAYEEARSKVANFINADFEEIVFTRGASSALNFEAFKSVLTDKTKVVALTYVSNVMGYITPIAEIIKLAHSVGAVVSVDAAQAVPHMEVDVKELDCDFLSFSGHKLCGPTGIGVLYGKKELLAIMPPVEFGGDMADDVNPYEMTYKDAPYRFETGTPIIASAIGLGKACEYIKSIGLKDIAEYEYFLKEKAIEGLKKIPNIVIYNENSETGIIAFNVKDVHPHDAASVFDNNDVCIRAGHHCSQLIIKWLKTFGTLRASFYFYNTLEDVEKFIESVKEAQEFFGSL